MVKRVLITGITGMAGSHLAEFLLKQEPADQIFGTKRQASSIQNVSDIVNKVQLVNCNLENPTECLNLVETVRPDVIYHLAALSHVPDSWRIPHETISKNISMQLHLFEAIRQLELNPVIQVALSSEEYGKVYPHELPITENNPFRPLSPYAVSKVAQDMLAYQYHQSYGIKVVRTRAFNHEGPRRPEVFVTSNFAKQIAEIENGRKQPIIHVGNLSAKRDFSDVRDIVRAYYLATKFGIPGEDYIIASGVSRSIAELLDLLLSLTTVKIEVAKDPARMRVSDVEMMQGDPTKFKRATGWEPVYSFRQTVSDLLDDWRQRVSATFAKGLH